MQTQLLPLGQGSQPWLLLGTPASPHPNLPGLPQNIPLAPTQQIKRRGTQRGQGSGVTFLGRVSQVLTEKVPSAAENRPFHHITGLRGGLTAVAPRPRIWPQ